MGKYILKRIGISMITIFVLVTAVFFLVRLMPGGPFASEKMNPQIKSVMEAYYGLDKPLFIQYFTYLGNLFQGDFGYSMLYMNRTVNAVLMESFPYSFDIGIRALVFSISFGLVL